MSGTDLHFPVKLQELFRCPILTVLYRVPIPFGRGPPLVKDDTTSKTEAPVLRYGSDHFSRKCPCRIIRLKVFDVVP
jgi:hypothetical protein